MLASQRRPRFSVSRDADAPVVLSVERDLVEVLVVARLAGGVLDLAHRARRRERRRDRSPRLVPIVSGSSNQRTV